MILEGSKQDKNLAFNRMDALCRIESSILSTTEQKQKPTHIQDKEKVGVTLRRLCNMISTQNVNLRHWKLTKISPSFVLSVRLWVYVYLSLLKRVRNNRRKIEDK